MNYNISKNKQQKIKQIDKAQTALNPSTATQSQKQGDSKALAFRESSTKSDKKNLTLYVSEALTKEIDEFLQEYGKAKETRNAFFEEAIRFYLDYRKSQLQAQLEEKLQRLKEKNRLN